jgi:hypothetical protein
MASQLEINMLAADKAYWAAIKPLQIKLFTETYANEAFGKACHKYNLINNFTYLHFYLQELGKKVLAVLVENPENTEAIKALMVEHKWKCVVSAAVCSGIPLVIIRNYMDNVYAPDGISWMSILGDYPQFLIR